MGRLDIGAITVRKREYDMDWVMIVLILTTVPSFSQSHSHYLVNFTNEKLCNDAAANFKAQLGRSTETDMKIDVRAVCSQRK